MLGTLVGSCNAAGSADGAAGPMLRFSNLRPARSRGRHCYQPAILVPNHAMVPSPDAIDEGVPRTAGHLLGLKKLGRIILERPLPCPA